MLSDIPTTHPTDRQAKALRTRNAFSNLSAPFVFRERRLSQHHPWRVTDQALAGGNIRADPGGKVSSLAGNQL